MPETKGQTLEELDNGTLSYLCFAIQTLTVGPASVLDVNTRVRVEPGHFSARAAPGREADRVAQGVEDPRAACGRKGLKGFYFCTVMWSPLVSFSRVYFGVMFIRLNVSYYSGWFLSGDDGASRVYCT